MINEFLITLPNDKSPKELFHYIIGNSLIINRYLGVKTDKIEENLDFLDSFKDLINGATNEFEYLEKLSTNSEYVREFFKEKLKLGMSTIHNIYSNAKKDFLYLGWNGWLIANDDFKGFFLRDSEMQSLYIYTKRKVKNNIITVGPPGSGKTSLVQAFTSKFDLKIFGMNIAALYANTKHRGEFEEKIEKIFRILKMYKIPIFIDEFHAPIGSGSVQGGISFADLLKPIIIDSEICVIGATTDIELGIINNDGALRRRFNIIEIKPMSLSQISSIFKSILGHLLYNVYNLNKNSSNSIEFYKKMVNNQKCILKNLDRNTNGYFPDKLVDFLDLEIARYLYE